MSEEFVPILGHEKGPMAIKPRKCEVCGFQWHQLGMTCLTCVRCEMNEELEMDFKYLKPLYDFKK